MKLQLFKGTYGVLMVLAMAGLFMMLRRQTGSTFALVLWLCLILLAAVGLAATQNVGFGTGAAGVGFVSTLYLRFGGAAHTGGNLKLNLVAAFYALLTIGLGYSLFRGRSNNGTPRS